ncbi:MAG: DUF4186 domain-containing protein [Syntrophobacteraceae bacterium]|nr:DUF4186 domain-containing protein [Syntrophobacteraceae bacterium]
MTVEEQIDSILSRLRRSQFRTRFQLTGKDLEYFKSKGMDVILRHGADFLKTRLAPANPHNDTRQTPFKGHPIFIAQHATATCCRKCLEKWHKIERGKALDESEKQYIIAVWKKWLEMPANDETEYGT